jgi:hypothetical protein
VQLLLDHQGKWSATSGPNFNKLYSALRDERDAAEPGKKRGGFKRKSKPSASAQAIEPGEIVPPKPASAEKKQKVAKKKGEDQGEVVVVERMMVSV